MADSDTDPHKVIRQQFERSAELAAVADDLYAKRWSEFHEIVAEIAVRRLITEEKRDA